MLELLQMWAILEVLGIVFLPLTVTVFHNLPDRGWAFSKTIGLAVLAFCVWLPLMVMQMLPFSQPFILGVLLLLLALNVLGFWRTRRALLELIRTHVLYLLCVELIFFGMVFLLGWLRSYSPDIRSFEMFMDEGFLSAIMRSSHFPPNDMWYAGQPINYYYYAHYTIAMLAKLLGQSPLVAFNTGISVFFGLTAVNLFGVTANIVAWAQYRRRMLRTFTSRVNLHPDRVLPSLKGAIPYGVLAILLGEILGNLAATQTWWQNHDNLPFYYWFNASRVISDTINEFPAFSFLLSCFHAHVLALAFTILGIGLAFNLLLEHSGQGFTAFGRGWRLPFNLGVTALSLGGLFAMNGWDYPTYLALALVCLIFQQWLAHNGQLTVDLVLDVLTAGVALGALSFLLFAPFYINFVSPAQGLGIVSPKDRSPLAAEVLIYGIPGFILVSFLLVHFFRERVMDRGMVVALNNSVSPSKSDSSPVFLSSGGTNSESQTPLPPPATPELQEEASQATAVETLDEPVEDEAEEHSEKPEPLQEDKPSSKTPAPGWAWSDMRLVGLLITLLAAPLVLLLLKNSVTFVVMGALALMSFVLVLYHVKERERSFVLLLGTVACALVAFCEVIFLKDVFADQVPRMNTVFKFYFQAWALLAIVGGAGVYFVLERLSPLARSMFSLESRRLYLICRVLWSLALLAFLLMGAVYPLTAAYQRYDKFTRHDFTLDGLNYLSSYSPDDYQAIRWINNTISGDPGIIEADGSDYSDYGRVSAYTGLPSPMNWIGHEWQWRVNWVNRGNNSVDFGRRADDVKKIYTSADSSEVLALMSYYGAKYLYVGSLEQAAYQGADLQRFGSFMRIVYHQGAVTIYQVP